jgi:prepilin-type N-terminal cleavage/methylation domain-containing protein
MSAHRRANLRSGVRSGFTLVELMVSLTVGAIVIMTVYTIGGASARNFQEQQRISQLQLSTRIALDRVRRDVERAGLHGTPNSTLERLCTTPTRVIRAVTLDDNASSSRGALNAYEGVASNTTTQADLLRIVGNFVTSDAYLVRSLNGAGNVAFLQTQWQGFRRSFADVVTDPTGNTFDTALFSSVFAPGRMLHVQNMSGNHFFVTVVSASIAGTDATVTFTPSLPVGGTCVVGLGEGSLLAPLSEVQYELVAAPSDQRPTLDPAVTGPNVSLVRRERHMTSGAVLNERTVLEWAVHFDVDAVIDTTATGLPPDARLFTRFNDAAAETQVSSRPERVRSLIVTIGGRTPEQDPRFPWVAPAANDPLTRFRVFTTRVGAARVRTATSEINLPNLVNRGM